MSERLIEQLYEKRAKRVLIVVIGIFALIVFVLLIMVWGFKYSPEHSDKLTHPLGYFLTGLGAAIGGFLGFDFFASKIKQIKDLKNIFQKKM